MKGEVKVYRSSELLCQEPNMIVDAAGESFVDVLTAPPSMNVSSLGDTDTIVDTVFDTSNYTIGLMSFGKSETGYRNNLHKYKRHNLIASASNFDGLTYVDSSDTQVLSPNSIDGSSVVRRLSSLIDEGGYVEWSIDNGRIGSDIRFLYSNPLILTLDIKPDLNNLQLPACHDLENDGTFRSYTSIDIIREDPVGSTSFEKRFTLGFTNPLNLEFGVVKGFLNFIDDSENVSVVYKSLGNGWYRVGCVIPSPSNVADGVEGTDFKIRIYPCSDNNVIPGAIKIGSILVSRMSLTQGSVPINYHLPNEPTYTYAKDLEEFPPVFKSIGQHRQIHFALNRPGTLTNYPEGFNVSASLCQHPSPLDTTLQPHTLTDYAANCALNLPEGQNLNFYPYIEETFLKTTDYLEEGWQYTSAYYTMPLQDDFSFLGGFAPLNARLDRIKLYDNNSDTAGNQVLFNSVKFIDINGNRTMDERGYLRVFADHEPKPGAGDVGIAKVVSTSVDARKGVVTYQVVIPKADVIAANCFGGIFEIGLHALDIGKIRDYNGLGINISVDKSFNSKKHELFGKLFCKKSFTFDITNTPVFENVSDVKIVWELDFCNN